MRSDYRAAETCARCGLGLEQAEANLTPEGDVVCRSCSTKHQLAQLPKATMSFPDGSLLLGLRHVFRQATGGPLRLWACILGAGVPALFIAVGDSTKRIVATAWFTAWGVALFFAARKHRHVVG